MVCQIIGELRDCYRLETTLIAKLFASKRKRVLAPWMTAATIAFAAMSTTSAHAAKFGVSVVDESGAPVSGASVCFGLPGNYGQFGMTFTDSNGQAMTEVPNIPFIVTVSKTRFSGIRVQEPARGYNLIKQVRLSDGTPGPRCKAGSTLADSGKSAIDISGVNAERLDSRTRIQLVASGNPDEYRLSPSRDLSAAGKWAPLDGSISVPESLAEREEIFMQLRRYEGTSDSWLEALSRVVSVTMPLVR